MKKALFLIATLFSFLASVAQTPTIVGYRASSRNGQQLVMALYSDGSRKQVSSLPNDAVVGRKGGIVRLPYAPENKAVFNPAQFGSNKYFNPNFKFSIDFNPGGLSPTARKAQGVNLFNFWSISGAEKATLPAGDGMLYLTESGLHGNMEGSGFYLATLAQYEARIWSTLPTAGSGADPGASLIVFNIEQSNGWGMGNYTGTDPGKWPSWDSVKNTSIVCEHDGQTRTLQQLQDQGKFEIETQVRRANRLIILHKAAKAKGAPGTKTSYGASMYQGLPRIDFSSNSNGIFQPGSGDVSHIGGSNGTITLNGRTYTGVSGSHWSQEDVMCGYYYLFNFEIDNAQDYQDIWVNKLSNTQNYPYLWPKIRLRHIVADEKGYWQLNQKRMMHVQGSKRGILRMMEPIYEADAAGYVAGQGYVIHRIPFADLQANVINDSEAPKIWQPPYMAYSRYAVARFMAGNEPGNGFYLFPAISPNKVRDPLSTTAQFNHHVHTVTALFQARHDLQPYESWFTGSTLVEDPEVQINQSGSFTAYDGTTAYNYDAGVEGPQKPAYILRYKATANGWRVLILGGMNQGYTTERTDIVKVPNGGLNGNSFKVKLRGPAAQVYEFAVRNTDTGQVYEALPNANTSWERPAYAGRVGVATVTPPPTTACNFSVTGGTLSSGCSAAITLSATTSGPDATGLTYSWSGNGASGTTASINATAPGSNGQYVYTVTVSKSGCTAKTATRTLTVSGCSGGTNPPTTAYYSNGFGEGTYAQLVTSAPFVPQTNQLSTWNSNNGSGQISSQYLDNGTVKIGFLKATGAAITHLSLNGGPNWVNTNADGYQGTYDGLPAPDAGRSGGASMYGTPGHNYQEGGQSTSVYYDTGYNPVHGGSAYRNYSPVQWYERRTVAGYGEVIYFKTQPYIWALNGVISKSTYHQWYWFDSQKAIKYFYIIDNQRDDNQRIYEGREQEFPFIFTIADLWHHHIYQGNAPGTSDAVTDIGPEAPVECGCPDNDKVTDALIATEGWISSTGNNGQGVFLVPQHNTRVVARQVLARGGNETSNATSYINSAVMMNYDVNVATAVSGYIYLGSMPDFRPWYNDKNITHTAFDWTFRPGTTAGWWTSNKPGKFNSENRYEMNIGGNSSGDTPNGGFNSPHGRWKASDIPTIYITTKLTGNGQTRTLNLQWRKPGDTEVSAAQNNNTTFQAIFDGVERTYAVPMAGVNNWTGMIGTIRIQNVYPFPTNYAGNEKLIPTYIGNVNPATNGLESLLMLSLAAGTALKRRKKIFGIRANKPKSLIKHGQRNQTR